jgi:hypothetical protein
MVVPGSIPNMILSFVNLNSFRGLFSTLAQYNNVLFLYKKY